MTVSRRARYLLEYALMRLAFALFKALPLDGASAFGGWIGRRVGPRLKITSRARKNISRALPELTDAERAKLIGDMWDHLGRVFAEYPHLGDFQLYDGNNRVEVVGAENVDQLRDDGIGGIFVTGHFGNWELAALSVTQKGVNLVNIYRAANNPWVERLIVRCREPIGGRQYPKSGRGARNMLAAIKAGEHLGILVDQKYNEGIPVPFFGRDAMTAPSPAEFALRFRVPIVLARVERLNGARFRLTLLPPLDLPDTGDHGADVRAIMVQINNTFEEWIRARPEQWLWLHRRWPKEEV